MASGDRSAPTRLAVRAKRLREAMREHGLGTRASSVCRTASFLLLAATLLCVGLILVMDGSGVYYIHMDSGIPPDRFRWLLIVTSTLPSQFLFWSVMHWSAAQLLAELGFAEDLVHELAAYGLGPERAPGESEGEGEAPGGAEGRNAGRPRPTVHRCRLLVAVCGQANKLRLEADRWLHVPSCVMVFVSAWYLPILIRGLGTPSGHPLLDHAGRVYMVVGSVGKLAPFFCAQLAKHRRQLLASKAAWAANDTDDPELRRALRMLRIVAENRFSGSRCVLVDIDLSLLPVLLSVVVLMTTTFFSPEDA